MSIHYILYACCVHQYSKQVTSVYWDDPLTHWVWTKISNSENALNVTCVNFLFKIMLIASTSNLQPSIANANQLPEDQIVLNSIIRSIDNSQHKHCISRWVTIWFYTFYIIRPALLEQNILRYQSLMSGAYKHIFDLHAKLGPRTHFSIVHHMWTFKVIM